MLQHKAYKFRIYLNKEQEILIAKTIGCCRFVYNHFLNLWNEEYAKDKKGLSYPACSALLPKMKKEEETHWLQEVDSIALQSSVKNLANAFTRFFKKQDHKPQFKSKKNPVQSYITKNVNNSYQAIKSEKLSETKAKSISEFSWSSFVEKLEYKAEWYERKVIKIDRWFLSSKRCSTKSCDYIAPSMPLAIRKWTCPHCHTSDDRDTNASINILIGGLRIQTLE